MRRSDKRSEGVRDWDERSTEAPPGVMQQQFVVTYLESLS